MLSYGHGCNLHVEASHPVSAITVCDVQEGSKMAPQKEEATKHDSKAVLTIRMGGTAAVTGATSFSVGNDRSIMALQLLRMH